MKPSGRPDSAKIAPELGAAEPRVGARLGRRQSFWRRYGVAGAIALGLHAALAFVWPEPEPQVFGHGGHGFGDDSAMFGDTVEMTLLDDDDALLGELTDESPPPQEQRPAQADTVVAWDFDPNAFTQEVALDALEVPAVDVAGSLAGQMSDAVRAALRAMQESLGESAARRGRGGVSFGKSGGILYAPNPPYPPAARREGREGMVELLVLVDARGRAKRAEITNSSGHKDFDDSALNTVLTRWQFPGRENELQIVRVVFTLLDKKSPGATARSVTSAIYVADVLFADTMRRAAQAFPLRVGRWSVTTPI